MSIMRAVATFALGYAAARGVDRLRKRSQARVKPAEAAANAEARMKARADRFRDQYTHPRDPGSGANGA